MRLWRILMIALLVLVPVAVWAATAQELIMDLNGQTGQKQHEAALRLGNFNYPEVVSALSAKLSDEMTGVQVRAACGKSLGKLRDPSTYPMLKSLAQDEEEKSIIRSACVGSMAQVKGTEALPDIMAVLANAKSRTVIGSVERALVAMEAPREVTEAVTPLLKNTDTAPTAIRVLGKIGGPEVVAPLAAQLGSKRSAIRLAVIDALGNIPFPSAVPPLLKFYPKANLAEKVRIISALAHHAHPAAQQMLLQELSGGEVYPALRKKAAMTLSRQRYRPAIEPMVRVMLNTAEQTGLRLACTQSLGNYSDRDHYAIAGLIGALDDKVLDDTAATSLYRITRRYLGTSKEKWKLWFEKHRAGQDVPDGLK